MHASWLRMLPVSMCVCRYKSTCQCLHYSPPSLSFVQLCHTPLAVTQAALPPDMLQRKAVVAGVVHSQTPWRPARLARTAVSALKAIGGLHTPARAPYLPGRRPRLPQLEAACLNAAQLGCAGRTRRSEAPPSSPTLSLDLSRPRSFSTVHLSHGVPRDGQGHRGSSPPCSPAQR